MLFEDAYHKAEGERGLQGHERGSTGFKIPWGLCGPAPLVRFIPLELRPFLTRIERRACIIRLQHRRKIQDRRRTRVRGHIIRLGPREPALPLAIYV